MLLFIHFYVLIPLASFAGGNYFIMTLKEVLQWPKSLFGINAKLAEENEFVTHSVQKCLETRENEQNVV